LLRRTDDGTAAGLIERIAHEPADERPQIPGPGHGPSFSRQIAAEAVISSAVISPTTIG